MFLFSEHFKFRAVSLMITVSAAVLVLIMSYNP